MKNDTEIVKKILLDKYNINVKEIDKVKRVFRIYDGKKEYCFKVIKYNFGHFLFIINAMNHLAESGFDGVIPVLKTVDEKLYVKIGEHHGYLTEWLHCRQSNYDNPIDIGIATKRVAQLHQKSEGFEATGEMNPRIGWKRWISTFSTRKDEILDFKSKIARKDELTDFDEMYLEMMDEELERCDRAINNLIKSNYNQIMEKHIQKRGFCHHDCADHNVLIDNNNNSYFIDFDYCILDTHLHDLTSILIRTMKNGRWNIYNAEYILDKYREVKQIEQDEIPVMAAFMEFPQAYWQVGIQYYWEHHPWDEWFFLKKLRRIKEDNNNRQKFVDEFRNLKLK